MTQSQSRHFHHHHFLHVAIMFTALNMQNQQGILGGSGQHIWRLHGYFHLLVCEASWMKWPPCMHDIKCAHINEINECYSWMQTCNWAMLLNLNISSLQTRDCILCFVPYYAWRRTCMHLAINLHEWNDCNACTSYCKFLGYEGGKEKKIGIPLAQPSLG